MSSPQQEQEQEEEEEQEHGDIAVGRNETSVEGSRRKRMVSGFGACDGDNGGGRSPSAGWDASSRTLEDARAEGARRHDAAARRERALAYAYAYQQVRRRAARASMASDDST